MDCAGAKVIHPLSNPLCETLQKRRISALIDRVIHMSSSCSLTLTFRQLPLTSTRYCGDKTTHHRGRQGDQRENQNVKSRETCVARDLSPALSQSLPLRDGRHIGDVVGNRARRRAPDDDRSKRGVHVRPADRGSRPLRARRRPPERTPRDLRWALSAT